MNLIQVINIEKGGIATGLPYFDAIKIEDLSPLYRLRTTSKGYSYLAPLYLKLLVVLNSFPVAINPTYLISNNPELVVVNSHNLPIHGIDISGNSPLELALFTFA